MQKKLQSSKEGHFQFCVLCTVYTLTSDWFLHTEDDRLEGSSSVRRKLSLPPSLPSFAGWLRMKRLAPLLPPVPPLSSFPPRQRQPRFQKRGRRRSSKTFEGRPFQPAWSVQGPSLSFQKRKKAHWMKQLATTTRKGRNKPLCLEYSLVYYCFGFWN